MGCMKKLGCLLVVVVIAIVAFLYRDGWIKILPGGSKRDSAGAVARTWQPLTPEGSKRAQAALNQLRAPRGPAYVTVGPGDLAAYILQELAKALPPSADSIEAAAIGDRLFVRAVVNTRELGGNGGGALGPLSALLGDRERIQLGGTLRIIRPGYAELAVKEAKIGNLSVPQPLIPRLIRQISRGLRPPELAADGLPLQTPEYVGDVRVSDGKITLYKAR